MSTYVPRPGSRTEAAINYLRAQGGAATAIDVAEAIDTERNNLPATLKAAMDNGLLEPWDLPNGKGYCLCGSGDAMPGTPRARKDAKARFSLSDPIPQVGPDTPLSPAPLPQGERGEAPRYDIPAFLRAKQPEVAKKPRKAKKKEATEIRPYLGRMPRLLSAPKKPRKAKAAPAKSDQCEAPRAMVGTAAPAGSFRVGHYSDGSVRLEGLAPAMIITDGAGELPSSVMLTPEAARIVARFIGSAD